MGECEYKSDRKVEEIVVLPPAFAVWSTLFFSLARFFFRVSQIHHESCNDPSCFNTVLVACVHSAPTLQNWSLTTRSLVSSYFDVTSSNATEACWLLEAITRRCLEERAS